jgi:hypothetical protein
MPIALVSTSHHHQRKTGIGGGVRQRTDHVQRVPTSEAGLSGYQSERGLETHDPAKCGRDPD